MAGFKRERRVRESAKRDLPFSAKHGSMLAKVTPLLTLARSRVISGSMRSHSNTPAAGNSFED
jgi:hypothetical protein